MDDTIRQYERDEDYLKDFLKKIKNNNLKCYKKRRTLCDVPVLAFSPPSPDCHFLSYIHIYSWLAL